MDAGLELVECLREPTSHDHTVRAEDVNDRSDALSEIPRLFCDEVQTVTVAGARAFEDIARIYGARLRND